MTSDSKNSKKEYLITVALIFVWLMLPVYSSIMKWNEQPKRIVCQNKETDCKLQIFSYKHEICWNRLLSSRHTRTRCKLPKILQEEIQLFSINNMKDVILMPSGDFYEVRILNTDDESISVAKYKKESDAEYLSQKLNATIKKWQYYTPDYDNEIEEENTEFIYNFTE